MDLPMRTSSITQAGAVTIPGVASAVSGWPGARRVRFALSGGHHIELRPWKPEQATA